MGVHKDRKVLGGEGVRGDRYWLTAITPVGGEIQDLTRTNKAMDYT